jgi:propanol-preferring alcohol dehydrogenase
MAWRGPPGARHGLPWLGKTFGHCNSCRDGRENLCDDPGFAGYARDDGFAPHVLADVPRSWQGIDFRNWRD